MHFGEEERCQDAKLETYTRSLLQRKQIAGEVQINCLHLQTGACVK